MATFCELELEMIILMIIIFHLSWMPQRHHWGRMWLMFASVILISAAITVIRGALDIFHTHILIIFCSEIDFNYCSAKSAKVWNSALIKIGCVHTSYLMLVSLTFKRKYKKMCYFRNCVLGIGRRYTTRHIIKTLQETRQKHDRHSPPHYA